MTLDELYDFLDGYVPTVREEIKKAEEFVAPLEAKFTCTRELVNLDTDLEIIQARLHRLIMALLGKGEPEALKRAITLRQHLAKVKTKQDEIHALASTLEGANGD